MMNVKVCVGFNSCRCKGNVICNNHWTKEHTIIYQLQQSKRSKQLKILNLYAGIGGNLKLWGSEHEITAVEYDPNIAKIYEDL